MMARVEVLSTDAHCTRYRIDGAAGWCEFSVYHYSAQRALASFGGSVWPDSFPGVFEFYGPDRDPATGRGLLTGRSGYRVRAGVVLPLAGEDPLGVKADRPPQSDDERFHWRCWHADRELGDA